MINNNCNINNTIRNSVKLNNVNNNGQLLKSSIRKYICGEKILSPSIYNLDVDLKVECSKTLSGKQMLLIIPITKFFKNMKNLYILANILNGNSIISLRLIDYFVVNYVLENNTFFNIQKYIKNPDFIINTLTNYDKKINTIFEDKCIIYKDNFNNNDKITNLNNSTKNSNNNVINSNITNNHTINNNSINNNSINNSINNKLNNKNNNYKYSNINFDEKIDQNYISKNKINTKQIHNEILSDIKNKPNNLEIDNLKLNQVKTNDNFDDLFIVHDNYKCQLKEYNKRNFDPFCRDTRIKLYYENNNYFETTVAQLNFFKWSIENHIIDYILDNYSLIEISMLNYEKINKHNKIQKINKKNKNNDNDVNNNSKSNNFNVLNKKTKKNEIFLGNLDKRSKHRKKREFSKTNKSILSYNCRKVINFN